MHVIIFILNCVVLFSLVLDLQTGKADRTFWFGMVRMVLMLPLLAGTYLLSYFDTGYYAAPFFYDTENSVALLGMVLAFRLYQVTSARERDPITIRLFVVAGMAAVLGGAGYAYFRGPVGAVADGVLVIPYYGILYCSSLFMLAAVLLMGWRFEVFWRSLDSGDRWRYKYLVVCLILVCAMLGWTSAYRLGYLRLPRDHFLLLAVVLMVAWGLMVYALARHRLLNRKIFISRKVVYATITPIAFSGFFIFVGLMSLLSRLFGWPVPFVLQWLVVTLGLLAIVLLALSGSVRRNVKYFISTHFYVNKYEYRDEWIAFSDLLRDKLTEKSIVKALYQITHDSLYTPTILIWLGDSRNGFLLMDMGSGQSQEPDAMIPGDDALVRYLQTKPYLYSEEGDSDPARRSVLKEKEAFLKAHGIVLMVPLILGNQCVGLIGLGAETTGGRYGHDDFDLLAALCSHAASALLAVRNAEALAREREQSAWNHLSAFVLHDVKNAATMLDLVRKNAPQHMDNPEFQKDMLESIDDALKRMGKVQTRLSVLKGEMRPNICAVELNELITACCDRVAKKLPDVDVVITCPLELSFHTDPDFINQILENLLINAREAVGGRTAVRITIAGDGMVRIDLQDSGPGIPADLLPRGLFEPFKTTKPNGSGIGLWQVRQLVERLGGVIHGRNGVEGGAWFTILFPNRLGSTVGQNTAGRRGSGIQVIE